MLNQYHPRAPLKHIFVQNSPKPYCHFVILSRLVAFPPDWVGGEKGNDTAVDPNAPEGGSSYQPKATPWVRSM